jgi:hypothetical protein
VFAHTHYIWYLHGILPSEKIATIISLLFAVVLYCASVIALKIFKRDEILMIPFGTKILKVLEMLGIYEKKQEQEI